MSEGDFEVMPRGTMEEVRVLRQFVHKLNDISKNEEDVHNFVIEVSREIGKVQSFYRSHVERYPTQ
jgi:hypothetical protein